MLAGLSPSETSLLGSQKDFLLCPHMVFSLYSQISAVSLCSNPFSHKDTSQIGSGPTLTLILT